MPTRRDTLTVLFTAVPALAAGHALAQGAVVLPAEVAAELPGATALGSARLRFFGLNIYDSRLYVPRGFQPLAYTQSPFALELSYLRGLSGKLIAERSLKEMSRINAPPVDVQSRWLAAMEKAFPDVQSGDRITGMHLPGVGARFWFNGQPRATIADAEFSLRFFGIWLAESTSEPGLRTELLKGLPV
jgi:hypothetical protein